MFGPLETIAHAWRAAVAAGMSPVARVQGLTPVHVTEWAAPADCVYCADGDETESVHRHLTYAQYEGASLRTGDELAAIFVAEVEAITTWRTDEEMRAIVESTEGWRDDAGESQALSDECRTAESALGDAGLQADWEDGFTISEIQEMTESDQVAIAEALGTEHGKNAGAWVVDGNTTRETAIDLYQGICDGDPEIQDSLPMPQGVDAISEDLHSVTEVERAVLTSDVGYEAYSLAIATAVESEVARAAVAILDNESGLIFEEFNACKHCDSVIRIQQAYGAPHPNDGEWVHTGSGAYYAGNNARCLDNIDNIAAPKTDRLVMAFAWPGGYRVWYVTDDGGQLCAECCTTELASIRVATRGDGWRVTGHYSEAECDPGEAGPCDHCNRQADNAADENAEVTQ